MKNGPDWANKPELFIWEFNAQMNNFKQTFLYQIFIRNTAVITVPTIAPP